VCRGQGGASGLAAISTALLAVLNAGDHLLVTDSAYGPTRSFCDTVLARLGISTTYYDPCAGDRIAFLLQPNTRAVFTESPGSLSFEMQDIPAIAVAAHAQNAVVLMDNTWASPLYFRPLEHGVDIAIQSGTKYIGGHSDVMLGTIAANAATWPRIHDIVGTMGICVGPDDMFLGLRGLRTLAVRLARHIRRCRAIAATRSGSATSPAPAGCSPSCSSRRRKPRCTPSSTRSPSSAWAHPGAVSKASPRRSTAPRPAPPPPGPPAVRPSGCISGSRT
jgi:cystathionine beta-lyase/cystathionine gamma-synthase